MKNLLPEKSDITIIGGGSAGLALAFHLAEQDNSNLSVAIIESRYDYLNDRTWCFWDFDELHDKLRPLIRKRWNNWAFSNSRDSIVHHSDCHPYCAVSSGDFYRFVFAGIDSHDNFELIKGCQVDNIATHNEGYLISTSQGEMWSRYVIDTRPPIHDYYHNKGSSSAPTHSALFSGTILYQIFFGVEVELEYDYFDDSTVQLMSNLTEEHEGLAFSYVLPYSTHRGLVEYTTFTPSFFPAQRLRSHCFRALDQLLGPRKFEVVYEEGAILPMGFPGVKSSQNNLLHAGIVGGSVRASTGYAFIRTQRWAARCAAGLIRGRLPQSMGCDDRVAQYLDRIFLKVLRRNPQLSPILFMNLAQSLSAEAFARFMMEKSSWLDYLRVILSMPKKPFIKQLSRPSG